MFAVLTLGSLNNKQKKQNKSVEQYYVNNYKIKTEKTG